MNREEYLEKLRLALAQMPAEEKERQIAYYDELISDMCEDGMSETEATAKLGDPGKVAEELLAALPLGTLVKSRIKSAGGLSALTIALLVLGFPLWFPLMIVALVLVFCAYVVIWVLVICLWAVFVSFIAGAVCGVAGGVIDFFRGYRREGAMLIGAGVLAAGLSVFMFFACRAATKGAAKLTKKIALGVKSMFIRKDNTK